MSEIKVSKISSLSAAQTLQIGGKGMMIGGTAENTTLIISTTAGGIPTVPHGDMSLFITDGTVQSTYGYQTTSGSVVGEFLGTYSNHPVGIMTNNATKLFIGVTGNVGIGTTTPKVQLDVLGSINASASLTIAESEVLTTQRTFTQIINTTGSNTNNTPPNAIIGGQAWLLGRFSDVASAPAHFRFVHTTHTGNNLQSDSYEWSRNYLADLGTTANYSNWVELPMTTSATYASDRQFRFDVRAKYQGDMELRMRAALITNAYDGPHYFTFTTTGKTTYTPETIFYSPTISTPPTGYHGRQAYEFPVSKGTYGFSGTTAGVFILNSGNVGVGRVAPAVALDVAGSIRATDNLTVASREQILSTPHLLQVKSTIVGANYTNGSFNSLLGLYGTEGLGIGSGAGIMFGGSFTAGDPNLLTSWAEVSGVRENATSGLYDGALVFKTRSVSTGVVEAMRITSTGLVGIGGKSYTAAPQDILTVTPPFSEAPQGIGFYSAENLLRNGNFPNTTAGGTAEGWTLYTYNGASDTTNGTAQWQAAVGGSGPRGVAAVVLQCTNGGGAYQTVNLTPGAVYTVSARIRVSSLNSSDASAARFSIGVAATPTSISDATVNVDLHDSGNSLYKWCYCSRTFTVPASALLTTPILVGVRSQGNTHSIQVTDIALYKGGIAKVFSPITVQEDTQKVLINGNPAAYTEPDVVAAAASATAGFRFGAVGATALTNYSGYSVRYTKIGNLVTVEGLITNLPAAALGVPASTAVLKGLPPSRAGNNAISAVGWLQWTTATPMSVSPSGDLYTQTAFSIPGGNGSTTGGFIAVNFSYLTT